VSYGGPCFPRDNVALSYLARTVGANAGLAEATHVYNGEHLRWLLGRALAASSERKVVAVVGLAYRPDTNVIERSAGMYLAQGLVEHGRRVMVFDEHALRSAREVLQDSVEYASSLGECLERADVVVLTDTGGAARSLEAKDLASRHGGPVTIVDCWRACGPDLIKAPNVRYIGIGVGPAPDLEECSSAAS
jgi:UDPglucose 6-dehydrogenase